MQQTLGQSRRDLLRNAGLTVAAASLPAGVLSASPADAIAPMKIGVFGIDFTFWGIWADLLSPQGRSLGTSALRMRPTHIWDKDVKKAQDFAKRWGAEVVERYDGMVGKVDAVINGDLYNTPWQHLMMRPYLEAGIPCFLQRHWADTLPHLDLMLDLAAKHSAPVMATVPFEHYSEAEGLIGRLKNIGEIQSVFGTADVANEPHFHLPYMLLKVLGYDVEWVSMATDDVKRTGYLNMNYGYPKTDKRRPFVVSMQSARPDVFTTTIMGNLGTISAGMAFNATNYTRYFGQLLDIQRTFEKKAEYQPADLIRKKYLCLQAAYYSRVERNSAPVKVGSVPAEWALPAWMPNWYDGSEFKRA